MIKILFYAALISLLPAMAYAAILNNGNHTGPVSEYVKSHITPVISAKRLAFDAFLSSTEKNELASIREQLQQLHNNHKVAMNERSDEMADGKAATMRDEIRSEHHAKMKALMEQVQTIAANHRDELDKIFSELAPQRKQWKNEIAQIRASKENAEERNSSYSDVNYQHYGMGGRFNATRSRSAFLLFDPSSTVTSDNDRQSDSLDSPASSSTMSIFPNPAENEFTLNLSGIPEENKLIITDMTGKIILEKENLSSSDNETISISALNNGIYFVRLSTPDQTINQKLIISH